MEYTRDMQQGKGFGQADQEIRETPTGVLLYDTPHPNHEREPRTFSCSQKTIKWLEK